MALALCLASTGARGEAAGLADRPPTPHPDAGIEPDPGPLTSFGSSFRFGPGSAASARSWLPDLRTLPPSDLHIRLFSNGRRWLRFANTTWNAGQAALELHGELDPVLRRTVVHQRLDVAGTTRLDLRVGEFVWHPGHGHWHVEDYALYRLWSLTEHGEFDRPVASSEKLSYCLYDTDEVDLGLPHAPRVRGFWGCGRGIQGLSVGWGDEYKSYLEGQSLDITGLPDGLYALESTSNPADLILEADYTNNTSLIFIQIEGNRVIVVPSLHPDTGLCLADGKC